jgi:hypothetical protein
MRCPLCERPLGTVNIDRHHLVPRTRGGKATVLLHKICHQTIHSVFTENQLARHYNTIERLKADERIAKFVAWVSKRPSEFHDPPKQVLSRRRRR